MWFRRKLGKAESEVESESKNEKQTENHSTLYRNLSVESHDLENRKIPENVEKSENYEINDEVKIVAPIAKLDNFDQNLHGNQLTPGKIQDWIIKNGQKFRKN